MPYATYVPNAHSLSAAEVARLLKTDAEHGLKSSETTARLVDCGTNTIARQKNNTPIRILINQFMDPVIGILAVAAVLAFTFKETWEGTAVLAVIGISVGIGFWMERQAYRTLEALRKMGQSRTRLIRSGEEKYVRVSEVVPGDLVSVGPGDVVPADLRLVAAEQLTLKESALTGESVPVSKRDTVLADSTPVHQRINLLFKGTTVLTGSGYAIVVATGSKTQLGRIQKLGVEARSQHTPLERKLRALSVHLIWLTLLLALGIGILGYARGENLYALIETALALSIAAIPEGLPVVATIALARGMLRLSRRKVIVKNLEAVQTLGATDMILTDKTGTLTEDRLRVHSLLIGERPVTIPAATGLAKSNLTGSGREHIVKILLRAAILCNNIREVDVVLAGDTLEIALMEFVSDEGFPIAETRASFPESWELPFDPQRKLMATQHMGPDGYHTYVKGAYEQVVRFCSHIDTEQGVMPFTDRERWTRQVARLASTGLRTLAFAWNRSEVERPPDELLSDLTFLGVIGFLDPPRKDVRPVMEVYRKAGIQVVMVTGDHPDTARKIAEEVGLTDTGSTDIRVVNGLGVPGRSPDMNVRVYARVMPEEKLDLVARYQDSGHVVGMIGDGINDVPALSKADIGIAMGIRGTEAAREAADVILSNDSFASIELAIRQGRVVFSNIRQFVIYLLSCNLAEILVVAAAAFTNLPAPLLPMQILFLNLVTDVFPALALGLGPGDSGIMDRPPRSASKPILERRDWKRIGLYGLGISFAVLGSVLYGQYILGLSPELINNLAFYTLVIAQLLHVFNLPGKGSSLLRNEVGTNPYVWGALALSLGITVAAYLIHPLAFVLRLQTLTAEMLLVPLGFGLGSLILIQLFQRLPRER